MGLVYGGEPKYGADKILEKFNEYDIFRYYVGQDFVIGRSICSPLRRDKTPSFVIYHTPYTKYKLKFKDFSTGIQGSCFDLVGLKFNVDFGGAVKIISYDFGLGFKDPTRNLPSQGHAGIHYDGVDLSKLKKDTTIECTIRALNATTDKKYWFDQYGITGKTLKLYRVHPVTHVWLDGKVVVTENKISPVYGYYFGMDGCCRELWKILIPYAPNRSGNKNSKNRFKWLTNTPKDILQGHDQLPWLGEMLIITKSLKDVMVLHQMGYHAIASHSETDKFEKDFMDKLRHRFPRIVCFYDNDKAGISGAIGMVNNHGIESIQVPENQEGVKDISDYVKMHGYDMAKAFLQQLLNNSSSKDKDNEIQEESVTFEGATGSLGDS